MLLWPQRSCKPFSRHCIFKSDQEPTVGRYTTAAIAMKTIEILSAGRAKVFFISIPIPQSRRTRIGSATAAKRTGAKIIHSSQSARFHRTRSGSVSEAPPELARALQIGARLDFFIFFYFFHARPTAAADQKWDEVALTVKTQRSGLPNQSITNYKFGQDFKCWLLMLKHRHDYKNKKTIGSVSIFWQMWFAFLI